MTNFEKYKTAEERTEAFDKMCDGFPNGCEGCVLENLNESCDCKFAWLELEAAEEKPLPCPFCGDPCQVSETKSGQFTTTCMGGGCFYRAGTHNSIDEAIAAHNRVARAVMESKAKEAK